jgi:hypothetical protein
MKKLIWILIFGLWICSGVEAVPKSLYLQAKLTDDAGRPLYGSHRINVRITINSGPIWFRDNVYIYPNEQGIFEVILEGRDSLGNPFPDLKEDPRYAMPNIFGYEFWVDGVTISRPEFQSVPYALNSERLQDLYPKPSGADEHVVATDAGGKVAFGTVSTLEGRAINAQGMAAFYTYGRYAAGLQTFSGVYGGSLDRKKAGVYAEGKNISLKLASGKISIPTPSIYLEGGPFGVPPPRTITYPEKCIVGQALIRDGATQATVSNYFASPDSIILLTNVKNTIYAENVWISSQGVGTFNIKRSTISGDTIVNYLILN